jgi:hypothetical protein
MRLAELISVPRKLSPRPEKMTDKFTTIEQGTGSLQHSIKEIDVLWITSGLGL